MSNIILIHGGSSFKNYQDYLESLQTGRLSTISSYIPSWKDNLYNFFINLTEVLQPKLPNKDNAKYQEWKIVFERYLPKINPETILIGYSLGGVFLAKYFSENEIKAKYLHLVAPDFEEGDFVFNPENTNKLKTNVREVHLWQSNDDFALA
jgi:uncharacterized protein